MRIPPPALFLLALLLLTPRSLPAQADTFADPVARQLVTRARETRAGQAGSITSYTAIIRDRFAITLRMPLRDRLLARSESAARVRWSRDGESVVQLLASRQQDPGGVEVDRNPVGSDDVFDPTGDRLHFGVGLDPAESEELWVADPIAPGADRYYRYASGDTMTVQLSGHTVRAVQLRVIPRQPSFHYLDATLWIEPESGALVQAVYRPSRNIDMERDTAFIDAEEVGNLRVIPAFLRPLQMEFGSVVIQYSLWDLRHWLPRLVRVEGHMRAGAVNVPFERELSYEVERVEDGPGGPEPTPEAVIAGWAGGVEMERVGGDDDEDGGEGEDDEDAEQDDRERGSPAAGEEPPTPEGGQRDGRWERDRRLRVYAPADRSVLLDNEHLPPPVWEEAPEFAGGAELDALVEMLERSLPRSRVPLTTRLEWGLAGDDLIRYNRVEGLSVGASAVAEHPLGELRATLRLGSADLHPNAELAATLPRRTRTIGIAAYHRLAAVDGRALRVGNSLGAFLFGRDNGEYYRTTGARVTLSPPPAARALYRVSLFAERQRAVERGTVWSAARILGSSHDFRPNIAADDLDLAGASLALTPWWGRDPLAPGAGLDLLAEAATGDREFARSRLTARAILPLGPRHRFGLETAAGTSWGPLPAQYHWFLGGSETLRGYDAGSAVGPSFLRARTELTRGTGAASLALFADAAWAGRRDDFDAADALLSAGVGTSLLDGLLRLDLVRALRAPTGWRVELYLDALL